MYVQFGSARTITMSSSVTVSLLAHIPSVAPQNSRQTTAAVWHRRRFMLLELYRLWMAKTLVKWPSSLWEVLLGRIPETATNKISMIRVRMQNNTGDSRANACRNLVAVFGITTRVCRLTRPVSPPFSAQNQQQQNYMHSPCGFGQGNCSYVSAMEGAFAFSAAGALAGDLRPNDYWPARVPAGTPYFPIIPFSFTPPPSWCNMAHRSSIRELYSPNAPSRGPGVTPRDCAVCRWCFV